MNPQDGNAAAFALCLQGVEGRERSIARIWCALGSRRAVAQIDRWGGPRPSIELEVVKRALWLNAVDGLQFQNNPWWGSPRSETIPLGEGLRTPAYILLAVILRQDFGLMDFRFEGLGRWLGLERERRETWSHFRQRAFEQLTVRRNTEDARQRASALWATAAVGLTLQLTSPDEDVKAEAATIARNLEGLAAAAEPLRGEDEALAPTFYLGEGLALLISEQYEQAEIALGRGAELCPQRIWQGARLCNALETSYARAIAARRAHLVREEPDELGETNPPQ
ncbi:MAG: hypothetical protein JNM59_12465 [Hyphomonadaceae bacterium]|nr:hypothetical protein [Hyphomonadaceae bacterium]